LSDNGVCDENCQNISELIHAKQQFREIYLHWNNITGKGADLIFSALAENQDICVFDLSWNKIGDCTGKMSMFLEQNSTMLHFDISNNRFTLEECKIIAKSLSQNKNIFGFHFQGMYGQLDHNQNIKINSPHKQNITTYLKRIQGVERVKTSP
jgi:hypothetical protein